MAIQVNTNQPFIETRKKIGSYASFGGLALVFGSVILAFQNNIALAYAAMLVGFLVSNVGAYFMNRYSMGTHKKVEEALKGFDKRYHLYNYLLPSPNVLLTPYGVTVLLLKNQDGQIMGTAKGWRQGASFLRFVRAFSSEPLGDPTKELETQKSKMREFIEAAGPGQEVPIEGFVVFTNEKANVSLDGVPTPVITLNKNPDALKGALRRDKRTPTLPPATYDRLAALFDRRAEETESRAARGFKFWQR